VLSSLKNGPIRKEIEAAGGLKLVYIDPPFDVGADFSVSLEIGEESVKKEPTVVEEVAYRDTWGKGADSYLSMAYDRIVLIRDLLSDSGSIYVHCDWRVSHHLRCVLDEIFGTANFQNEIVWKRSTPRAHVYTRYPSTHDVIFFYSRSDTATWNPQYQPHTPEYIEKYYRYVVEKTGRKYSLDSLINPNPDRPTLKYEWVVSPKYGAIQGIE